MSSNSLTDEEFVLKGIIPISLDSREEVLQSKKNLLSAMSKKVQFSNELNALIYKVLVAYFKATGQFPSFDMFTSILQDNDVTEEQMAKASIKFNQMLTGTVTQTDFDYYVKSLAYKNNLSRFEDKLVQALDTCKEKSKFIDGGDNALDRAKSLIMPELYGDAMDNADSPRANLMDSKDVLLARYEEAKKNHGVVNGIKTGLDKIDEGLLAMVPGNLIVIAGASSEGKSWLATNIAINASTKQKKNVTIVSAEQMLDEYMDRLVVCHSNNPKFGLPLELTKLRTGYFSEEEEEVYKMVVNDLYHNDKYGRLDVIQINNSTTLSDVRIALEANEQAYHQDLIILDYLSLLKPTRRAGSQREEAVNLFKECKEMAITFNKGQGVPIISLHQISTQARDAVRIGSGSDSGHGFYALSSLADSSEAGKSCDAAIAIYRDDNCKANHELIAGFLKLRSSNYDQKIFKLFENYATGYVGNLSE